MSIKLPESSFILLPEKNKDIFIAVEDHYYGGDAVKKNLTNKL